MKAMVNNPAEEKDAAAYLPFVRKIAGRVARRLPQSVDIEDLMGAGTIGLLEALRRFDASSGRSFETYAEFRIKGAMLDELRRNDPLNRSARSAHNRVASVTSQLTAELGRPPAAEEMAVAMNTSVENYFNKLSPLESFRLVPLNQEEIGSVNENLDQEEQLGRKELIEQVRDSLSSLNHKQQLVLSLYYVEELNQAQIGEILGVSESRICQILSEVVKNLRRQVQH